MAKKKKRKGRYRFGIVLIVSVFILIVSFCAYMTNTTLEEVLEKKYPDGIVVHQENYGDNSSAAEQNLLKGCSKQSSYLYRA